MAGMGTPHPDAENPDFIYYQVHRELISSDGMVSLQYDLKMPRLKDKGGSADKINNYILDKYNKLLANAKEEMDGCLKYYQNDVSDKNRAIYHYTYDTTYKITYFNEQYLSILIEEYEYTGGAHGMSYREVLIFDRETGEEVKGEALFGIGPKVFRQKKMEAFEELFSNNPQNYWENALQIVGETPDDYQKWYYLTNEGVVFYYPPYELGPYVLGFVEALVPYKQIPLKKEKIDVIAAIHAG